MNYGGERCMDVWSCVSIAPPARRWSFMVGKWPGQADLSIQDVIGGPRDLDGCSVILQTMGMGCVEYWID